MSKHTPTPWNCDTAEIGTFVRFEGLILAKMRELEGIDHKANAARIVACVNAMAGIEDPQMLRDDWEATKHLNLNAYKEVSQERDELRKQCEQLKEEVIRWIQVRDSLREQLEKLGTLAHEMVYYKVQNNQQEQEFRGRINALIGISAGGAQ